MVAKTKVLRNVIAPGAVINLSRNLKLNSKGEIQLKANHGLLYVWNGQIWKLGELPEIAGKTPEQAINDSYGTSRDRGALTFLRIYIFDKDTVREHSPINKRGFDTALHDIINHFHAANPKNVPFFIDTNKEYDCNVEGIIGFTGSNRDFKTLDGLVKAFLDPKNIKKHLQGLKARISPRGYQQATMDHALNVLLNEHICLLHCFPGWGKSTMGLYTTVKLAVETDAIKKNKPLNIAVYSPIIDTLEGFVESATAHNYFDTKINIYTTDDIVTLENSGVDFIKRINNAKGEINLFVLSVQGVRFADPENTEAEKESIIRKRYAFLNKIDLFCQIRDEKHTEYGGAVTSKIFDNIESSYYLDLTATPYNLLQNQKYTEAQVVCDSMLHALYAKQHGNSHYAAFPNISIAAISPAQLVRESEEFAGFYTDEEDWDARKFLDRNGSVFAYRGAISDFFSSTIGKKARMSSKKNPMSVLNDPDLCDVSLNTIMIVIPEGVNGYRACENAQMLADSLNADTQYEYYFVTSYELTSDRKIKPRKKIEQLRAEHGKKIAIITHRKMTTGTDVPPLGAIIMLDKMNNPGEFEQLLGRMFRSYKGKDSTRIYIFCPGMNISHVVYSMSKDAATYYEGEGVDKEMYDCLPITLIDDLKKDVITYEDAYRGVLEETKRFMSGEYYTQSYFDKFPLLADAVRGLEFVSLKKGNKGTLVTGKNKAKISKNIPKTKEEEKKEKKERKTWKETLTVMLNEVPMIGYTSNCSTVEEVFETELAEMLFCEENCNLMLAGLFGSYDFSNAVNITYKELLENIKTMDDSEVHDRLFRNEDYKTKQGLVYVPYALAHEFLSRRNIRRAYKKALQKGNKYVILVPNALSGSIPLVAKELYPEAEIVCAEYFSYYIPYLKSLGFDVIDLEQNVENLDMIKRNFDCVLGNPPYQKAGEKKGKLWVSFLERGLSLTKEYLLFVTPDAWTDEHTKSARAAREMIAQHSLEYLSFDANEYFKDIGESICSFQIKKNGNAAKTQVIGSECITEIVFKGQTIYKYKADQLSESFREKIQNHPEKIKAQLERFMHRRPANMDHFKDTCSKTFRNPVHYSSTEHWYTDLDTSNFVGHKIIFNNSGYYYKSAEPNKYMWLDNEGVALGNAFQLRFKTKKEAKTALSVFRSKLYRAFVETVKSGGFNATALYQLPIVDFSRSWTDEELYKHFKLTKKEIEYIENAVK